MKKYTWFLLILCLISLSCKETDTIYQPVETLTDPDVSPVVIYTFPAAGTVGPYDGFSTSITVRFNKLMDVASLRHSIHFVSPAGELLPDTGIVTLNQGDVATITPIRSNLNVSFLWKVAR